MNKVEEMLAHIEANLSNIEIVKLAGLITNREEKFFKRISETEIVAIDPCFMNWDESRPALIVGKTYIIESKGSDGFEIETNESKVHNFSYKSIL